VDETWHDLPRVGADLNWALPCRSVGWRNRESDPRLWGVDWCRVLHAGKSRGFLTSLTSLQRPAIVSEIFAAFVWLAHDGQWYAGGRI
jgi:hypothetical protein